MAAVTVAIDAMGGDRAPLEVVRGALDASREHGISLVLTGDEDRVRAAVDQCSPPPGRVEIRHCTQAADMDESPVEVLRRKKDSSVRVAFDLVKEGAAQAAVSAGNTGASLAVGTVVLGRMPGVERPGIAGVFPTRRGRTVVMDIGANVDCKPSFLLQFGVMADAYAREALGLNNPKVGLLSIGEEEIKGNDQVRQARELLRESPLNFIGNVEGRDVFSGHADVVVCDGFVGNVVLKLAEGLAEAVGYMLKDELTADNLSRLGAMLAFRAFRRFRTRTDYAESGGAPLLGIKGVGIISHGRSSAKAIKNAVRNAAEMAEAGLPQRLEERLQQTGAARRPRPA